jgi:hypothetical protein
MGSSGMPEVLPLNCPSIAMYIFTVARASPFVATKRPVNNSTCRCKARDDFFLSVSFLAEVVHSFVSL